MKIVTEKEIIDIFLLKNKSAKFISLKSKKVEDTLKTDRSTKTKSLKEMFGTEKIIKESYLPVQVNAIYENAVNNRLEKAGEVSDFISGPLPWGEYVNGSRCIISHKGNYYLRVYQTNSKLGKQSNYYKEDGTELTEKEVEKLKKEFLSEKPEYISSQGLSYEKSVKPTNYNLKHIKEIVIDDEIFQII